MSRGFIEVSIGRRQARIARMMYMKRRGVDLAHDCTEVRRRPHHEHGMRQGVKSSETARDQVIFIYLPKKMKPEKQCTKP